MKFQGVNDILFIINPNSGINRTRKVIGELSSLYPYIRYIITKDLEELEVAFIENMEKYNAFIVVGGDGTVRAALKYLYNRNDKILGVLPTGSGNGFSRELGFKSSIKSLIENTKKGKYLEVDVLKLNDNLCINVAGLGIDSYVAHHFYKNKTRGLRNYIKSTIRSVLTFKPFHATLMVNRQKIEGIFLMITIANTRQFGNNAIISPRSNPTDGFFELVLVKPIPLYLYPIFFLELFLGNLKECRYIRYIKVKDSIIIKSTIKKYHVDGDPMTFSESLSVKMLKEKIRIIRMDGFKGMSSS